VGIAKRTVRGLIWSYTVYFGSRLFTLLSTAVLARLLVPDDFGLISYALLLLNFIDATQDFGVKDALIYSSERLDDTADSAFLMNLGIGLLQYGLAFVLAPLSLHLVDDPRIVLMLRLMSLAFIFNALGNTHDALLQKELLFKQRYLPDLYSAVIKGIAAIVLAFMGFGVWSLVASHVIGAAVRMIGKWLLCSWRPRFRFFMDRARVLWGYGVYILLFNVLGVALEQADQMFIGLLLGETQLGYYSIASRVPEMILVNFSLVLTKVIFPAYTKLKDDRARLVEGFLTTTKFTAFVTVPIGLGIVAIAPEMVPVVFGEQWEPAVILVQVLALLGMVATLPWSAGDVFKAVGRPDISTKLLLVEGLYTFPLIWAMTTRTPLAVTASFANLLALMVTAVLRLWLASHYLRFSPRRYVNTFRSAFVGGGIMFVVVMLWRSLIGGWSDLAILATAIPIGGVVYVALLWLLEREEVLEGLRVFREALQRSPGPVESETVEP